MPKLTVEMNDKMSGVLDELAGDEVSKAAVIRRSLTLLKYLEDQKAQGYSVGVSKKGDLEKEIVLP